MAARRLEDERFAYFAEASIVFLDLPDAVFRGYEGDDQLLAMPRPDDRAPIDLLRARDRAPRAAEGLPAARRGRSRGPPARAARSACALLELGRRWVMPGPDYAGSRRPTTRTSRTPGGTTSGGSRTCPNGALAGIPADVAITPDYADISDMLDRKIMGIRLYESQLDRLFGGADAMADAVRGYGAKVAGLTGRTGAAERYWKTSRL